MSLIETDILIVGAGPTGCAAAMAHGARGYRVALLDGQPAAARRFAGEWMHPPAVRALRSLGVDTERLATAKGGGFALYGSPDEEAVQLPYLRGSSLARVHSELVEELREHAVANRGVTYYPHHSFVALDSNPEAARLSVRVRDKQAGTTVTFACSRIIGADGRSSRVAESIGEAPSSTPLGYMMGVELHGIQLPHEGLGHVFFGGPGPALFYRVNDTTVRGCLDVPTSDASMPKKPREVFESFAPALPEELQGALLESLERATPWAATRFAPRGSFGRGNVWLAGDAAGHVHPITGMGMTFGILDAVEAARASSFESYRSVRQAYVSELLTNLLYAVFRRHDTSSARVRKAFLHMLRDNAGERERTMRMLMAEDSEGRSFARSFLHATGYSVVDRVLRGGAPGDLPATYLQLAASLFDDASWLKWPISAVLGDLVGPRAFRPSSGVDSPLPPVREILSAGARAARRVAPSFAKGERRGALSAKPPESAASSAVARVENVESSRASSSGQSAPDESRVVARESECAPSAADWKFCQAALVDVSRSFSKPIALLPQEQERALTVGYLLCRVVDTIEDTVGVSPPRRDALFSLFQDVLRETRSAEELAEQMTDLDAPKGELRLAGGLPTVMRVFRAQSAATRTSTVRWVSEMADGMRLFSRRSDGEEFAAMHSIADLERYCFYVAGTVGHLITELFAQAIDAPDAERRLRGHAESFGLGLQMVNIIKDVSDDHERGVCYLPRDLCQAEGFEPEALLASENREAAMRVVCRVADRAQMHLDAAMHYVYEIPAEQVGFRLFCLVPLWMAVETLHHARGHAGVLTPGAPVKISRELTEQIVTECSELCTNDTALLSRFAELQNRSSGQMAEVPNQGNDAQSSVNAPA